MPGVTPDTSYLPDNPMGYAAPEELVQQRLLAKSLYGRGIGDITGYPGTVAVSPFQAIGGLLQQYAGQQKLKQAAQEERQRQAGAVTNMPIAGGEGGQMGPLSMAPPQGGAALGYSSNPIVEQQIKPTIRKLEGNLNYDQLGPAVVDRATGMEHHAIGPYGIMDYNVGPWSKEVLGVALTPEQFRSSPQAQEAVASAKLGQYAQQYGVEGAGRAWLGGPGNANNPNAVDPVTGMTTGRYGAALASNAKGLPAGAVPPPAAAQLSATMPPGATQTGAGGPLAMAAPRGAVPLGNPAVGPVAEQGGQPIGPVPLVPRVSRQQFELSTMLGSPEQRAQVGNMYYGQNQPIAAQGFGGQWVIDPRGQMPPRFIPTPQGMPVEAGGAKATLPYYYNSSGQLTLPPGMETIFRGVTGAGGAAPNGGQPPSQQPSGPRSEAVPSGGASPAQVASLETGTTSDAVPPGVSSGATGGPLSALPPQGNVPPVQMAQAGGGGGFLSDLAAFGRQQEILKEHGVAGAKEAAGSAQKFADDLSTQATVRAGEMAGLKQLSELLSSPNVIQGFGKDFRLNMAKAWSYLTGSPLATTEAAQTDLVEKLTKDFNLDALKARLGGLGQIRIFEGNMINAAFANRDNMPLANQYLVRYAMLTNQRVMAAADLIDKYRDPNTGAVDPLIRNKITKFYNDTDVMPIQEQLQWGQKLGIKPTKDILERAKEQGIDVAPYVNVQEQQGGPLSAPPPNSELQRALQERQQRQQQKQPQIPD
jgi:hypothetical protein